LDIQGNYHNTPSALRNFLQTARFFQMNTGIKGFRCTVGLDTMEAIHKFGFDFNGRQRTPQTPDSGDWVNFSF